MCCVKLFLFNDLLCHIFGFILKKNELIAKIYFRFSNDLRTIVFPCFRYLTISAPLF